MEEQLNGVTVWFTGLSGSGKSTICRAVADKLMEDGIPVEILDGDDLRKNLTKYLGFSKADRDENVHRVGFVAHLLAKHGVVVLVALISPYRETRQAIRASSGNFMEVYVNAPVELCECRDPKGLYAKVRAGELWNFTGIDDPYEPPLEPDIECRTGDETVEESRDKVVQAIMQFQNESKFYSAQ
jgi:adenylylsulfate kinase